jgi:anthranilate/para-aminobenzoate synthase component I
VPVGYSGAVHCTHCKGQCQQAMERMLTVSVTTVSVTLTGAPKTWCMSIKFIW